jgi:hypothetical protein
LGGSKEEKIRKQGKKDFLKKGWGGEREGGTRIFLPFAVEAVAAGRASGTGGTSRDVGNLGLQTGHLKLQRGNILLNGGAAVARGSRDTGVQRRVHVRARGHQLQREKKKEEKKRKKKREN